VSSFHCGCLYKIALIALQLGSATHKLFQGLLDFCGYFCELWWVFVGHKFPQPNPQKPTKNPQIPTNFETHKNPQKWPTHEFSRKFCGLPTLASSDRLVPKRTSSYLRSFQHSVGILFRKTPSNRRDSATLSCNEQPLEAILSWSTKRRTDDQLQQNEATSARGTLLCLQDLHRKFYRLVWARTDLCQTILLSFLLYLRHGRNDRRLTNAASRKFRPFFGTNTRQQDQRVLVKCILVTGLLK